MSAKTCNMVPTRLFGARSLAVMFLAWLLLPGVEGTGRRPVTLAAEASAEDAAGLRIHPQNSRYFEYRGLPMVLFGHQAGVSPVPVPGRVGEQVMSRVSRHANHFYMAVNPAWVRATYDEVYQTLDDDEHWQRLRALVQAACDQDVIVHLFFWSYKFNFAAQDWSGSDMIWPDPADDGGVVVGDSLTRRELHRLAIERCVQATWDMPNLVYNFMWEYNVRQRGKDPEGRFHRWWVEQLRESGARIDPSRRPLVSVKWGMGHPSELHADFIVEEDGNGFFYGHPHTQVLDYEVPAVFISSDFVFGDNPFRGWAQVPHSPRRWEHGQSADYRITPNDLQAMVTEGFHPAEAWRSAPPETLACYLPWRWYLENLPTWANEPEKGLPVEALPARQSSARPELINPPGFADGRKGTRYAAIYRHPDGLAPAQAEVWIDANGDGRFDPDPAAGERIRMTAPGRARSEGTLFVADGPDSGRYVFRFADANWNPPVTRGLVPGETEGISYRSLPRRDRTR